jgi:hypothetical protein
MLNMIRAHRQESHIFYYDLIYHQQKRTKKRAASISFEAALAGQLR